MKIKPPSRSVLDPERFHDCADALEPYVYALLRMVDRQGSPSVEPDYRQIREAALAAGWDEVIKNAYPKLPMNDEDLKRAVERLASEP